MNAGVRWEDGNKRLPAARAGTVGAGVEELAIRRREGGRRAKMITILIHGASSY